VQVVDANVLLYASNERSPDHPVSRAWLEDALAGRRTVGFAWTVVLSFLRVSTSSVAFPRPLSIEVACADVEHWLKQPNSVEVRPGPRHLGPVCDLLDRAGTAGNLVNDAHLAALALENDAEVVSFDRGFGRFEGLRWRLPA
jgi:toxin-antitoxin system PIN domain toxin